jgi:trigger factor
MPKVERHDIDALNLSVTITLEKDELKKRYNSEINRYKQKAAVKGFRAGKTPEMVVKKMFGGSIFQDLLNEFIEKSVSGFIQDNSINILGQPIPSEDSPKNEKVTQYNIDDLVFKFDLGLVPEFEVKGISASDNYTKVLPEIPTDWIDNALESDRNRMGERKTTEDNIQLKDTFKLSVKEVKGTHSGEFTVLCEMLTEEMQEVFMGLKSGDSLQINLFHLEKDSTEDRVKRYFLGFEEDQLATEVSEMFDATISEVTRVTAAELNEEYFQKSYGIGVSTEEEAKAFIKGEYYKYMENDSFGLMVRNIQKELIERNQDIALPDAFLKRWLLFANPKNTEEIIEKEYNAFAKNLRWDLVRDAINVKFEVRVTEEDVKEIFKDKVRQMYGGQGFDDALIAMLSEHVMNDVKTKNKKEYNEAVETAQFLKFFKAITNNVTITEQYVSMDEFNDIRTKELAKAESERETQVTSLEENIAEFEEVE